MHRGLFLWTGHMEVSLGLIIVLCVFFFLAGFVDSIAGGGGLISTPAMLVCGLPPHAALGTGKLASTLGTLSSLWTFARNNLVVLKIAPVGFVSAFVGAMAGSGLTLLLDSEMLGRVLIFLLPVGMLASLASGRKYDNEGELPQRGLWPRVIVMGFFIGMYDGFFGPGTGSFFILAQHFLLRMGLVRASATAKVFNLASNAGAYAVFAASGAVIYAVAIPGAIANILGNQLGTRLAIRVGARAVRNFLYLTLTILLGTLIYRFFLA